MKNLFFEKKEAKNFCQLAVWAMPLSEPAGPEVF
jgi:hypothetical protein